MIRAAVAAALLASAAWVYANVRDHEFLRYDDDVYVVDNPSLRRPLDASAVARAFAAPFFTNWIPLTSLSLHLDYARSGADPAAFLTTNVALHALSSVVLFLALLRLGVGLGPSAFAAGVFGLHPLHVESVAWISARKDVLSGLFFGLALWSYAGSAQRPRPRHLGTTLALGAGLLAKPSLVALPPLLLLLDAWPLRRFDPSRAAPLRLRDALREKWLLFALAAAASITALSAQNAGGAMAHGDALPLDVRLANAALSIVAYLRDAVWPARLAAFYPHPEAEVPRLAAALAAAGIAGISALCFRLRGTQPWLGVGWRWFLGLLVPTLGLVQVGVQARADRYTYLPLTGLCLALAVSVCVWAGRQRRRQRACVGVALVLLAGLALGARRQVAVWRDSETLFLHAAAVTEGNFLAEHAIGSELLRRGEPVLAEQHFAEAVRLRERWAETHFGLADAAAAQGRLEEAIRGYERGLRRAPRSARGHLRLARMLLATGRGAEALGRARHGVEYARPHERAEALGMLGAILLERRSFREAQQAYEVAVALRPDLAEAHAGRGLALLAQGELETGYESLRRAEAAGGFGPALRLAQGDAARGLGREDEAREHFRAAHESALRAGDAALAADAAGRLGE